MEQLIRDRAWFNWIGAYILRHTIAVIFSAGAFYFDGKAHPLAALLVVPCLLMVDWACASSDGAGVVVISAFGVAALLFGSSVIMLVTLLLGLEWAWLTCRGERHSMPLIYRPTLHVGTCRYRPDASVDDWRSSDKTLGPRLGVFKNIESSEVGCPTYFEIMYLIVCSLLGLEDTAQGYLKHLADCGSIGAGAARRYATAVRQFMARHPGKRVVLVGEGFGCAHVIHGLSLLAKDDDWKDDLRDRIDCVILLAPFARTADLVTAGLPAFIAEPLEGQLRRAGMGMLDTWPDPLELVRFGQYPLDDVRTAVVASDVDEFVPTNSVNALAHALLEQNSDNVCVWALEQTPHNFCLSSGKDRTKLYEFFSTVASSRWDL